jgi:AraC family transcriptional regulator
MVVVSDLTLAFKRGAPIARPLRQWRGFAAEHVVLGAEPYSFERLGQTHYIASHDMIVDDGEVTIDGLAPNRSRDLRHSVAFIPKGRRSFGWMAPKRRRNSFTAVYFDPGLVSEELERRYDDSEPPPFLFLKPPALQATLAKLENILTAPAVDDLLAESVCLVAALEVFAIQADPVGVGLSERQMATIEAFVGAHLAEDISLTQLAALCGLSRFHFSRAFKKTAGISPYAYVTERRIDRAKDLLLQRDLAIEWIAAAVGFPSSSQFRRAFRTRVGCSAQEYRKTRR